MMKSHALIYICRSPAWESTWDSRDVARLGSVGTGAEPPSQGMYPAQGAGGLTPNLHQSWQQGSLREHRHPHCLGGSHQRSSWSLDQPEAGSLTPSLSNKIPQQCLRNGHTAGATGGDNHSTGNSLSCPPPGSSWPQAGYLALKE